MCGEYFNPFIKLSQQKIFKVIPFFGWSSFGSFFSNYLPAGITIFPLIIFLLNSFPPSIISAATVQFMKYKIVIIQKLYENFHILCFHKRIVSTENIRGSTEFTLFSSYSLAWSKYSPHTCAGCGSQNFFELCSKIICPFLYRYYVIKDWANTATPNSFGQPHAVRFILIFHNFLVVYN